MIGPYEASRLLEFKRRFPDTGACVTHMASRRWPDGFVCPRCGHTNAWYHAARGLFDCKGCRFQASVTSGTIVHGTRLSLMQWYQILYLMAMGDAAVSTAEIQRLLNIRQYRTAWAMVRKVHAAAAERNSRYRLSGLIELDSSFFKSQDSKPGAGRNTTLLCAASLYHDRFDRDQPGFAWMQPAQAPSEDAVKKYLDQVTCGAAGREKEELLKALRTRGWQAYGKVSKAASLPYYRVVLRDPRHAEILLPWIHRLVSATKSVVTESSQDLLRKHRRAYLAELCSRFNRKFWEKELFDRLVETVIAGGPAAPPPESRTD